jgi:hypothetical protein
MTRVLVVNHDTDLADAQVDSLRLRGYEVLECLGPIGAHCPILARRSCPLAEWAEVLVYDAWATGEPDGAMALIEGLRTLHPDVPIVLSAPGMEPSWVQTAGPLSVTPLVGPATGARLAEAVEAAVARGASVPESTAAPIPA